MQKVYFIGKLAGANRKEVAEIVKQNGGHVAKQLTPEVDLIVVGDEYVLRQDWNLWNDQLDAATRKSFENGTLTILAESDFWKQYGGHDFRNASSAEYTPSMLAKLMGLTLPVIRRLHREGFILPVRQVHRLCYFGSETLLPLKLFQNMTEAGLSLPDSLDRLRKIRQRHPADTFSGAQIEGKDVIIVTKNGRTDQNGQLRLFFEPAALDEPAAVPPPRLETSAVLDSLFNPDAEPNDPVRLCEAACDLEASGNLRDAAHLYRAALAAGGAEPQIHFQLADVLYRLGDLSAARERYFAAIEQDENFVEARGNLGCVFAELGEDELAAAAFRGALKLHPGYAEVRLHFGRLLQRQGLSEEAEEQFRIFYELMPECKNVPLDPVDRFD